MTSFGETLRRFMNQVGIGAKNLSKLTGIPKPQIDCWLREEVRHPRRWPPLLTIAHVLRLTLEDADALLRSAGYPTIAELVAQLAVDHPDRRHLQPWVGIIPLSPISHHQLRAPIGDFVGRTTEVDQLITVLTRSTETGGIATITGVQGMGGIGKTELAYVVANQVQGAFPDAQIVLPLRGSTTNPMRSEQALQAVIHAFTPEAKLPDDLTTLEALYRTQLHERRVFILADDARDAAQIRPLLPPPGCALLVTSRQRFALPAMITIDLEQLAPADARGLLRSICPHLTDTDAIVLAQACSYLPLALRVSGSLLRTTPALAISTYLAKMADTRQRLALLRDPEDPELDVAASLTLSYTLLRPDAQHVLRQLGCIVADFATNLAQTVVEMPDGGEIEIMLHQLLRRNLVMYDMAHERWRMHDLVRDLAQQHLEQGEAIVVHRRYAQAAIKIVREAQDLYRVGGNSILNALVLFDSERPHIDAMRQWAVRHAGTPDTDQLLVDITTAMISIVDLRYDTQKERIPQWEDLLGAARRLGDQLNEGKALNGLGMAYFELGDFQRAISYHKQRLIIARAISDQHHEGHTLGNLGDVYAARGDSQHAIDYYEQSLNIARTLGNQREESVALANLGTTYMELGDFQRAIIELEHAITIARKVGDRHREGIALGNLGLTYKELGDFQQALDSCAASRTIMQEIGDRRMEGYALNFLAQTLARQGNRGQAITAFEQAITLFHDVGDSWGEADCQWEFGLALFNWQEREQALPLLRAAVAYEKAIGYAKADEHAALLMRLEAGDDLPPELRFSPN